MPMQRGVIRVERMIFVGTLLYRSERLLFVFGIFAFDAVHTRFFEIDIAFKETV
jgi:hypothetical protein